MTLVRLVKGAWKLLVGIKDALVLIAMLIFFGALFAALSVREHRPTIHDGALLMSLDGTLVEDFDQPAPFSALSAGSSAPQQYRLRDLVRVLDAAGKDSQVKTVVLDLDRFMGGYPAAIQELGAAIGRVRASGKPVLAYATGYTDDSYLLAANASEVWVNPIGGALFMGPGGSHLYYKGLLDKLGVTAHVYRVGTYKSAVEPYIRSDQSPAARENYQQLYGAILSSWRDAVAKARPKAQVAAFQDQPDKMIVAAGGDIAKANLAAGLVDKIGDRIAFGKRVAQIAGHEDGKPADTFKAIRLADYVDAHPVAKSGDAIGVVTISGEIVDGKSKGGAAGGDTIAKLILDALAKKELKALVVRVDSPGGSVLASERIRQAILQAKAAGLPVVTSMGSIAASGGYWISTPGDVIFAEPNTITGSIGIFGILPTFEKTLAKIGINADGVKMTPLSGQPDIYRGTNEAVDTIFQAGIENGYRRFVSLVSNSRHLSPERVDQIAQGRVWDGGTAHQLRLVDRFGNLSDAIAEAARRAKLDPNKVHAQYLEKEPGYWAKLAAALASQDEDEDDRVDGSMDLMTRASIERRAVFAQALGDARRLATGASMQAACLECRGFGPAAPSADDARLMDVLLTRVGL